MCIPLFEDHSEDDHKKKKEINNPRFPGDTEGYRKYEYEYWLKNGHDPDYNGEP